MADNFQPLGAANFVPASFDEQNTYAIQNQSDSGVGGENFEPSSFDAQGTYANRNQSENPKPGVTDMLAFAPSSGNETSNNSQPYLPKPRENY